MPTSAFWKGFCSGLSAPVSLYAPAAPYMAYAAPLTPAQSFGLVGVYMQRAASQTFDERSGFPRGA